MQSFTGCGVFWRWVVVFRFAGARDGTTRLKFTGILSGAGIQISMDERGRGLARSFRFYNHERPQSTLENKSPASCHLEARSCRAGRLRRAFPNGPILGGPVRLSQGVTL